MQFSHPSLNTGWPALGTGSCLDAGAVFDASALACVLLLTGATTAAWESCWELCGTAPGMYPGASLGASGTLLQCQAQKEELLPMHLIRKLWLWLFSSPPDTSERMQCQAWLLHFQIRLLILNTEEPDTDKGEEVARGHCGTPAWL